MRRLLAIDLGLRCGLAVYRDDGRLETYRSRHFGSRGRLRAAILPILRGIEGLAHVVMEGDRTLGASWEKVARRLEAQPTYVPAESWRQVLLLEREQHTGDDAKRFADGVARRVIAWSQAPAPTSLRHDAAEAILIGLWGVLAVGWLDRLPAAVVRR
jgi:hypothetical protein